MSVHLVGGGWEGDGAEWAPFLSEAAAHAGGVPRIVIVAVRADAAEHAQRLIQAMTPAGRFAAEIAAIGEDGQLAETVLDGVDAILVGGGLTPAYLRVLLPAAARLRSAVDAGVPYAGFSAGSAIAARRALVGGYRLDRVPVVDPDTGEDLDELTVLDGLDLLPLTVEVHAAQWGTLARLLAATQAGRVDRGVAIDERTALIVDAAVPQRVVGAGNVWFVEREADGAGVRVRRQAAE